METFKTPCAHQACRYAKAPFHCPDCGCEDINIITTGLQMIERMAFNTTTQKGYTLEHSTTDGDGQQQYECANCQYVYKDEEDDIYEAFNQ